MIVDLPVVYRGSLFSVKMSAWRELSMVATRTVDIREMDNDCAVAATGVVTHGREEIGILWHDGSHWVPETKYRPDECFGHLDFRTFDPDGTMDQLFDGYVWQSYMADKGRGDVKALRKWIAGERDEPKAWARMARRVGSYYAEVERFDVAMDGLRLYDGHLYRRIPVPYYTVDAKGRAEITWNGKVGEFGVFRLDRVDDMKQFLSGTFGMSEGDLQGVSPGPIQALIADHFDTSSGRSRWSGAVMETETSEDDAPSGARCRAYRCATGPSRRCRGAVEGASHCGALGHSHAFSATGRAAAGAVSV